MKSYRWTCNSCHAPNEPTDSHCMKCGCSATASAEEIEEHQKPEKYRRNKSVHNSKKSLMPLMFSPYFLAIYIYNGHFESMLFFLLFVMLCVFSNIKLLMFIAKDKPAVLTLTTLSTLLLTVIIIRLYLIPDSESGVGWGLMAYFGVATAALIYIAKNKHLNLLLERFYAKS
ncbi:zinc finger Ran-binding domain-containing protein [Agarivorans sp. TSD2052]|uniref:zinc finger Ran-binding domain-containing protein n=1 Tax=Agarivorans sp. TSD2052 TaxID=2937286 RepID=UPI0020103CF4|nr:zinc finger Ran-binding domain-containing protein [Agarivorans sp. TSD2052]UPW18084.1 zinc finger Ran-binding domain-containing protein [Agarivorans sp. TSD2052]